jgi:putative hydrolase of the HAD superfamily
MIRNILCDIGNVILFFDLLPALRRLHQRPGLSGTDALARLVHHRDLMEIGRTTPAEFLDALRSELGFPGTSGEARVIFEDIFAPNEPMAGSVAGWKAAGLRLVLFSNISPIHVEFIHGRYPVFQHFDEAIYSFRTGDLKPHDGMYLEAIHGLGLEPAETFYLDDSPANAATGRRFGFVTHVYDGRNHNSLLEDLAAAGVA